MSDKEKTKDQFVEKLAELRCQNHRLSKRILELEAAAEEHKRAAEKLRQSESMMRAIGESAQDAIVMMDVEGRISYWNPAAARTFGYTDKETLGRNLHHLLAPGRYQGLYQNAFPEFQRSGRGDAIGKTLQLSALRKTGEEFPMELSLSTLHLGDGWHAIGIIRDITDRIQAQKALEESEEKFRQVVDNMNEVFWLRSADNRELLYVSPSYEHIWGKTCQSLHENPDSFIDAIADEDKPMVIEKFKDCVQGRSFELEYRIVRPDGDIRWIWAKSFPVKDARGNIIRNTGLESDITKRKQAEAKIHEMAYYDCLTGLPNRKLFADRLNIAIEQARRNQKSVAVMMIDLDNFKDINDTRGHDAGDLLLKAAADRLSGSLRKSDTVARFGGDEFVLILPDLDEADYAARIAAKIVDRFRKPFEIDGHPVFVTASLGVAVYPGDGTSQAHLLKNADIAMYQAKQAGRDKYQLFQAG